MQIPAGLMHTTSKLALARSSAPPPILLVFEDVFIPGGRSAAQEPFSLLANLGRVPMKCYYCDGTGKCQFDYPRPGSGKDGNGEKEYYCSGSGKCDHCGGSGWLNTRIVIIGMN
jgi:hypothetical protein